MELILLLKENIWDLPRSVVKPIYKANFPFDQRLYANARAQQKYVSSGINRQKKTANTYTTLAWLDFNRLFQIYARTTPAKCMHFMSVWILSGKEWYIRVIEFHGCLIIRGTITVNNNSTLLFCLWFQCLWCLCILKYLRPMKVLVLLL